MRQLVQEKENSEFKPVKLRLKIDLVSYPARAEGMGKYDSNKKRKKAEIKEREKQKEENKRKHKTKGGIQKKYKEAKR